MPARIAWYIFAGGIVLAAAGALAQPSIDPPEAAAAYEEGERLLADGEWVRAAQVFEQLAGQYPESSSLPAFVFQRAKANYYLGDYGKAVAGFSYLLSRFPDNPEIPYTHFFLGNSHYRRGELQRALGQYLAAYRVSTDDRLSKLAGKSALALLENAGSVTVGVANFEGIPDDRRCPLMEEAADVLLGHGHTTAASELLAECGRNLDADAEETARRRRENAPVEVAVLLPLSGDLQDFGNQIYNGAVVGAEMYAQETGRNITIVPYDTEGYLVDAARVVGELSSSSAVAAIGPLTSEAAAVASARLHSTDLPLLIPAATEAGITRLSETSFQLSPNIELEAVRMADYAVDALEATTAVVIAPSGSEEMRMAKRFAGQFETRGGKVVASAYYRARDNDFGQYIFDIKSAVIGAVPDSSFWLDERGDTIEIDGLPATVDVIYLPGDPEQIRMLLPQIRFYNLNGQYLGSDGWGDEELFRLGDDVTQQAVFPSPFLPTEPTEESVRMSAAYDARYGGQPDRLARLGYDAVRLITMAIDRGGKSREQIAAALKSVQGYAGASGIISFGDNRENIHMPLYRIVDGAAVPISFNATESR